MAAYAGILRIRLSSQDVGVNRHIQDAFRAGGETRMLYVPAKEKNV